MNNNDKTILQKFTKELSTLHYAMTFGAFVVTSLLYYFTVRNGHFDFSDSSDFFLFLCPLIAVGGVLGGWYTYKSKLSKIDRSTNLEEKLAIYRAASTQKFALLEGPAIICALAMMQTENLLYLIIALALIMYLFTQKVSESKITQELGLD